MTKTERDWRLARSYAASEGGSASGAVRWLEAGGVPIPTDLRRQLADELAELEQDEAVDDWGDTDAEVRRRYVETFGIPGLPGPSKPKPPAPRDVPAVRKPAPPKAPPKHVEDRSVEWGDGRKNSSGLWLTAPHDENEGRELERVAMGYSCPIAVMDERHGRRRPLRNPFRWQRPDGRVE